MISLNKQDAHSRRGAVSSPFNGFDIGGALPLGGGGGGGGALPLGGGGGVPLGGGGGGGGGALPLGGGGGDGGPQGAFTDPCNVTIGTFLTRALDGVSSLNFVSKSLCVCIACRRIEGSGAHFFPCAGGVA